MNEARAGVHVVVVATAPPEEELELLEEELELLEEELELLEDEEPAPEELEEEELLDEDDELELLEDDELLEEDVVAAGVLLPPSLPPPPQAARTKLTTNAAATPLPLNFLTICPSSRLTGLLVVRLTVKFSTDTALPFCMQKSMRQVFKQSACNDSR